ncbi:hypothetical protein [Gorillibacterium sp. sgz500922]|uniref:hypothetical protein n=1 Tax=Gorillibacterium sp. sgz500922 TaxID=3446694 RepID=UPI003F66C154
MSKTLRILLGAFSSVDVLLLSIRFLFFNPYSSGELNPVTVRYIVWFLIVPALVAFLSVCLGWKLPFAAMSLLMLPLSLYFGVAVIPALGNLYLLSPAVNAILLKASWRPISLDNRSPNY